MYRHGREWYNIASGGKNIGGRGRNTAASGINTAASGMNIAASGINIAAGETLTRVVDIAAGGLILPRVG